MRILVYGAGVLGGVLAHALLRAGNDVTILARGDWKKNIDQNGLVIRHWVQRRTTVDRIKTIDALPEGDIYDIIFVVMQYTQLADVLGQLAANKSTHVVLVGNNMRALEMQAALCANHPKQVLFAFQSSGGRRENGKIICVRMGTRMTLGSLQGEEVSYPLIRQAFKNTKYTLTFSDNIDAWLKCHIAFVMPIAYVVYACKGDLKRADKALINKAIDASSEGYAVLETLNIPIRPQGSEAFVRAGRKKCFLMLWVAAKTPIGHLVASDHAMAAIGEMRALGEAFEDLIEKSGVATPAWQYLRQNLP